MNLLEEIYIQQFFAELIRLQREEKIPIGSDMIINTCGNLLILHKTNIVNNMLGNQNIDGLCDDYLLAFLRITFPIKENFSNRLNVFKLAEKAYESKPVFKERILSELQ
jgi:hypothetical protein